MKLTAMVMVGPGEEGRYLGTCIESLLGFCDEIRVRWEVPEGSSWVPASPEDDRLQVLEVRPSFFEHEGKARQELLDWTMEGHPTHILAIDADEFVFDGPALREAIEEGSHTGIWKLTMTEIWGADANGIFVRMDGAWRPRPVGILFAVPPDHWTNRQTRRHWRMPDKALACGRVPLYSAMAGNRTSTGPITDILHFGWACKADRKDRYQRYVVHDGGLHHKSDHLDSIMWGDDRVATQAMKWPTGLDKKTLLERVNRG